MCELSLFGCSLDPDEREMSIKRKIKYICSEKYHHKYVNPYEAISKLIDLLEINSKKMGAIDVESWLTPFPDKSDLIFMSVPNFVSFIDSGGCYEYLEKVCEFTKKRVLPNTPFLIGVDHSLTGGVLKALSEKYEKAEIGVIFIDSHFDGISLPISCGVILHDNEEKRYPVRIKCDPYLLSRVDSYNTESFIKFLIKENIILPNNVICIGVSNYPSKKAFDSEDVRIKKYIEEFTNLEKKGLIIIKKEDIRKDSNILRKTFDKLHFKYVYISIDMDIGANASCEGVRFSDDYIGMMPKEILKIMDDINNYVLNKSSLVGLDLMEIDVHTANELTYTLGLQIIEKILYLH